VRITTRYDAGDLLYGLMSTVHEVGHGLYDQGIPADHHGTPAGDAPSLGIHESQSRLWENHVARSLPFCRFLCATLDGIPVVHPGPEAIHRGLNRVEPSFIRTEADETTYNLHVCLRFEIERALIEGRLDAADVPDAWDAAMRRYLGVAPPDHARGALQDVHWSGGAFGYFPTYTLGNLYAAQLYAKAVEDIPGLEEGFAQGDFGRLLAWLRTRVHLVGGFKEAADIVRAATGSEPDPSHFLRHVERRCGELYRI
jgi:carboxypeptidase Taq